MSNELFPDGDPSTTPPVVVPPAPLLEKLPDEVADLVGPGKKYATAELALKALGPSQQFIEQLKEENRILREKTEQGHSIEEVYAAVKERLEAERVPMQAGLDAAGVAALVDSRLTEMTVAQTKAANEARFKSVLAETFGDKAGEKFNQTAEELGYTRVEFSELARNKPEAALKLLGVEKKFSMPKQITNGVNSDAFVQRPQDPPQRKNVMQGSTTKELVDAWRQAKPTE